MKTTYKFLTALAGALLLAPALFAQTPVTYREDYVEENMVGLNKYLLSNTPNGDGEYTLRLETFVTGSVSKKPIPTDFVLVLDNSGSMLFDCLYGQERPDSLTKAENDDSEYLRLAHPAFRDLCHYSYSHIYNTGDAGTQMASSGNGRTIWHAFYEGLANGASLYYFHEDDQMFYKIHEEEYQSHYHL